MIQKKTILDEVSIGRMLMRMAHEIVEKHRFIDSLALVGIHTRGVSLAQRIAANIKQIADAEVPVGALDITFYRDDIYGKGEQPVVRATEISFDINDKDLVIIDDVLFTGRTTRAAMDALMDYGRPRRIMLAVLVDRGHRELPIKADIVGKNLPTMRSEHVRVYLKDVDPTEEVVLLKESKETVHS